MRRAPDRLLPPLLLLAASGCAGLQGDDPFGGSFDDSLGEGQRLSGVVGVAALDVDVTAAPGAGEVVRDDDFNVPFVAAQWQKALGGEAVELGFEAGFSIGWDTDRDAVYLDDGSAILIADNELCVIDLSLGGYASTALGERFRLYGGVGPLVQFAWIDLDFDQPLDGRDSVDESGLGFGYYARAGLEYEVSEGTGVGLVARWADATVDLGGLLDELAVEGVQVGVVVTTGF